MKIWKLGWPGLAFIVALCLSLAPAEAQTKPPESASKIWKVLLYNKVGGWLAENGIAEVKAAFMTLAEVKGFQLVQLDTDDAITLEYLQQFQVIVWNNNTNGAASVPGTAARQAVLDYVDQGGGWMLICNAGDHANSWRGLAERMGTTFRYHARTDRAEVVLDTAARAHGELKWMVQGFPEAVELKDIWLSFWNTVRPLPGVTVVAISRAIPGIPNTAHPPADGSGDNVYIWAREIGKGRLLYNAIGFGSNKIMEQQNGFVPRLYWENIRYAAGDYQNGCTTPASPGFDAAARVHVEAMCSATGLKAMPFIPQRVASMGGRRIRLTHDPAHSYTIRVRDIRGTKVWERSLPAGTGEIALDEAIRPGLYLFEVWGSAYTSRQRLLLP